MAMLCWWGLGHSSRNCGGGGPSHCFQVALGVSLTPTAFPSGSRPPRELCGVGRGLKGFLPTGLNVFWSQSCKASRECPNPLPPSAHKAYQGLDLAPRFLVSLPTIHSYTPLCLLQNSDVLRPAMLHDFASTVPVAQMSFPFLSLDSNSYCLRMCLRSSGPSADNRTPSQSCRHTVLYGPGTSPLLFVSFQDYDLLEG